MTIKEFFESEDKIAIYCENEEQTRMLMRMFDNAGYKWSPETSYLDVSLLNATMQVYHRCYSNTGTYNNKEIYESMGFRIIPFIQITPEFTLSHIKTGDVCETRDGTVYIANAELKGFIGKDGFNRFDAYQDNLKEAYSPNNSGDIMKIYRPNDVYQCSYRFMSYTDGELVYDRREIRKMTRAELEKLVGAPVEIID